LHRASSKMGRYSPRVLIGEKDVFIALRAYIDRSGTSSSHYVSLAAFGAPDDVWLIFERAGPKSSKQPLLPLPTFT